MKGVKLSRDRDDRLCVERFPLWRRVEHVTVILTFSTLVLTGFPQKFFEAAWAQTLLGFFGGLDHARSIHRIAGITFVVLTTLHLAVIVVGAITKRLRMSLVPTPQDLRDAWQNLRFYFGLREKQPKMPKFDYRQKFEYIGMVMGSLIMVITGVFLMWPVETAGALGGQALAASRVAHSNEAVLALLVLIVWHVYSAVFAPDVFPLDRSMCSGKMTVEELKHRHTLEYERIFPAGEAEAETVEAEAPVVTGGGAEPEPAADEDEPKAPTA